MKEFISNFTKRGLIAAGFGPFILTIFYYAYYLAIHYNPTSVLEINKNILSSLILAFIAGGISAIFKVEKLSLGIATLINAVVIYIDYLFFYLFNDWVEMSFTPLTRQIQIMFLFQTEILFLMMSRLVITIIIMY